MNRLLSVVVWIAILAVGAPARAEEPVPPPSQAPQTAAKVVTLTQAPKLPVPQVLAWSLIERDAGVAPDKPLVFEVYSAALEALGWRVRRVDATPGPETADFALLGTAEVSPEGAEGGQKGARLRLAVTLRHLGRGDVLLSQTFEAYGAGPNGEAAKRAALNRLSEPLGVLLVGGVRPSLERGIPIRLVVEGFSAREEQEDFELVMASVPGFFDYHLLPATHDRLEFEVTIQGDSLRGFLARAEATQGLGLSAGTVAPGRIQARYSPARAFHLPGVVLGFEAENDDERPLLDAIESELKARPGLFRLVFMPGRLRPPLAKARAEFAAQYGSGLLLVPKRQGERLTLTLYASNGQAVASAEGPADAAGIQGCLGELLTALPRWLTSKGSFLKGLRARQYKAWRSEH